jgi:hypothetical protein
MRKIWSVLFAIIVFSPAISATAIEPDFKDIYLPIIQSISISHEVSVTSDSSGKKQYPVVFKVDLNVKVNQFQIKHLIGMEFGFQLAISAVLAEKVT